MKYYKLTNEQDDLLLFLESKNPLSDRAVKRELVDMGELDPVTASESLVEEISEEEYEENC